MSWTQKTATLFSAGIKWFFLFLALHICNSPGAQTSPGRDSLSEAIRKQANEIRAWQDSFTQKQDSIYKANTKPVAMNRADDKPGMPNVIWITLLAISVSVLLVFVLKAKRPS